MERERPGESHHVLCRVLRPIIVGLCSVLGPICTTMPVYIVYPVTIEIILNGHAYGFGDIGIWNQHSAFGICAPLLCVLTLV